MLTFENGIDYRCRESTTPTVARFRMDNPNDVFRQIQLRNGAMPEYRYIVIGTQYGYIHTIGGDIRTWKTPSGAYKFIKGYNPF